MVLRPFGMGSDAVNVGSESLYDAKSQLCRFVCEQLGPAQTGLETQRQQMEGEFGAYRNTFGLKPFEADGHQLCNSCRLRQLGNRRPTSRCAVRGWTRFGSNAFRSSFHFGTG